VMCVVFFDEGGGVGAAFATGVGVALKKHHPRFFRRFLSCSVPFA